MAANDPPRFCPLTGLYEASGIQQLADGRFVVVQDEKRHALSLLAIDDDGNVSSSALQPPDSAGDVPWELDDLEGVAVDRQGYVYAITSHSRDAAGKVKHSREKLVRFRIAGDRVVEPIVVAGLKRALIAAHPQFAEAAEIREVKTRGGLNIEGLEITPDGSALLLGFRSPLLEGRAIVARLENPRALFESAAQPELATPLLTLDLAGNGIRGLAYIPCLGGYLVIAGPIGREAVQFTLWFWDGEASGHRGSAPRRVTVPGLASFEHAEGVSPATIGGRQRIVIVSDDGDREEGRFGRFLILDPTQLRFEDCASG